MRDPILPRVVLLVVLTLSTVVQSGVGAAQSPEPALTYEEARSRLEQLVVAAEDLRAQIDRSQFDLEALSSELGFDAADVIAFVRDEIAFEQYPGLLRGPQGTLIGRAGNALDHAVLLTTLLTHAGYETRIVRAELSPEQAHALVDQMALPRKPEPPVGDLDAIRAILTEIGRGVGLSDEEIARQVDAAFDPLPLESTAPWRAAQADTEFVLTSLRDAGVELGDPNALADIVDEARDYFWVEYRLGPSDPWEPVHPAHKDPAAVPEGLAPAQYFADRAAIPVELQHRFRFQVFIEQWVKGELIEHPVMSAWEAPVADLVGTPVTFHNNPDGLSRSADAFDIDTVIEQTELLIPLVNDAFPPDLRVFDLTGTPTEFEEIAPNEYAATFDLGELIGTGPDGVDLFGSPDPSGETFPVLTAQWIDYTLIAPDGTESTHRRMILDRIGIENRVAGRTQMTASGDEGAVKAALLRHYTFAIASGELSSAFVLDQALERFIALRPLIELGLERRYFPDRSTRIPETIEGVSSAWAGHPGVYLAFDQGARAASDINYRHEPSLIVYTFGPTWGAPERVRSSIDIVSNARRDFSVAGGRLGPASAESLVTTGVWETHAEALVLANAPGPDTFNTMVALERAEAASIPVRVVTSEDDLVSAGVVLSPEALANLRADLADGYIALVPSAMTPGEEMTGWWRVEPRTGKTLGMTSDGRGQASAEYLIAVNAVIEWLGPAFLGGLCGSLASMLGSSDPGKAFVLCAWGGYVFVIGNRVLSFISLLVTMARAVMP
jgi:hypothetical protein